VGPYACSKKFAQVKVKAGQTSWSSAVERQLPDHSITFRTLDISPLRHTGRNSRTTSSGKLRQTCIYRVCTDPSIDRCVMEIWVWHLAVLRAINDDISMRRYSVDDGVNWGHTDSHTGFRCAEYYAKEENMTLWNFCIASMISRFLLIWLGLHFLWIRRNDFKSVQQHCRQPSRHGMRPLTSNFRIKHAESKSPRSESKNNKETEFETKSNNSRPRP